MMINGQRDLGNERHETQNVLSNQSAQGGGGGGGGVRHQASVQIHILCTVSCVDIESVGKERNKLS